QAMKSHILMLLYIVVAGQKNYHADSISSDVYNKSNVHVMQDGHQDPISSVIYNQSKVHMMQDGHQDPISSVIYNQSKVHIMQDGHQDPISNVVYNQSKLHMMQDDHHQPEYYGYEPQCPEAEDIAPCFCNYTYDNTSMKLDCAAVESEEQLKQIFKADFPIKNFFSITFERNSKIKVLEAGVFNGISFKIFYFAWTNLE
ncbi:unnamed protein product, partial [Meganyctiphanes norvegica]